MTPKQQRPITFKDRAKAALQKLFWHIVTVCVCGAVGFAWVEGKSYGQDAIFSVTAQAPVVKSHEARLDSLDARQKRTDAKVDTIAKHDDARFDAIAVALSAVIQSNPKAMAALQRNAEASKKGQAARDLILGK